MKLLPKHVECGRVLVGWSQGDLAKAAGVARTTIARFERDEDPPLKEASLLLIQAALEAAGVEFLNSGSPGVRLRPRNER